MSMLTPHGACLLWRPELIWLNAVSDAMLAIAFFSTAFVLGYFLWRRRDLTFRAVFGAFAVFVAVCGVTRLLGAGLDVALAQLARLLAPLLAEGAPGLEREAMIAALNGVLGDYLAEIGNPLAIEMRLRHGGHPLELERQALRLALPQATRKLVVLVHGSCRNDRQWTRQGHDHGAALARDLGFTPVYLHYNSGLQVRSSLLNIVLHDD